MRLALMPAQPACSVLAVPLCPVFDHIAPSGPCSEVRGRVERALASGSADSIERLEQQLLPGISAA